MTASRLSRIVQDIAHAEPHGLFDLVYGGLGVGFVSAEEFEIGRGVGQGLGRQFDDDAVGRLARDGQVEVHFVSFVGVVHGEHSVVDGVELGEVAVVVAALQVTCAAIGAVFLQPAVAAGVAGARAGRSP